MKNCSLCQEEQGKLKEPIILPMDTENVVLEKLKAEQRKNKMICMFGMIFILALFIGAVFLRGQFRDEGTKAAEVFGESFGENITEAELTVLDGGKPKYYTGNAEAIDKLVTVLKNVSYEQRNRPPVDFACEYHLELNQGENVLSICVDGAVIMVNSTCYETNRVLGESLYQCFKEEAVCDTELDVLRQEQ